MSLIYALMLATAVSNSVKVSITIMPSQKTEMQQCSQIYSEEVCDCVGRYVVEFTTEDNIHQIEQIRQDGVRMCKNPDMTVDNT